MNRLRSRIAERQASRQERLRPTGPRWLRVGVWVLAGGLVAGGSVASVTLSERQAAAERRAVAVIVAQPPLVSAGPASVSGSPAAPGVHADGGGTQCTLYQTESNCVITPAVGSPKDFLPAYRWNEIGIMNTDVDVGITHLGRIGDWALSWIAQLVFGLASFIWRIILMFVNLGANANWLADSALVINRTIDQLAVPAFLLATVMWVVVLAKASKLGLRGDLSGLMRAILVFVIPLGLMATVLGGAHQALARGQAVMIAEGGKDGKRCWDDQGTSPQCGEAWNKAGRAVVESPMSATWLAFQVQQKAMMLSGVLADGMLLGNGDTLSTSIMGSAAGSESNPNCGEYLTAMFSQYKDASAKDGPLSASDRSREAVYLHANLAWVSGMYLPWSSAAYGDSRLRGVAGCHELETTNHVPAALQQATMGRAYPGLITSVAVGGYRAAGNDAVYRTSTEPVRCAAARAALIGDRRAGAKPAGNGGRLTSPARAEKDPDRCLTAYTLQVAGERRAAAKGIHHIDDKLPAEPLDAAKLATGPQAQGENGYSATTDQGVGSVNGSGEAKWRALDWAACTYLGNAKVGRDGKWVVHPDWYNVGGNSPAKQDDVGGDDRDRYADLVLTHPKDQPNVVAVVDQDGAGRDLPASAYCTVRWNFGHGVRPDTTSGDAGTAAGSVYGLNDQFKTIDSDKFDNAPGAGRAYSNYVGQNSSNRLVYSVLVALGAYAYFRLVGVPALGLVLASIALVVLLCFLPLTLVFVAGGFEGGRKLGRMTLATAGSKALFLALLTFVVEVHFILSGLVNVVNLGVGSAVPVTAGFANTVMLMLMPLGLIWVVDKTTEALGLGKLSSLKGGATFTLNAAMKAGNAGNLRSFTNGAGNGASKAWDTTKQGAAKLGGGAKSAGRYAGEEWGARAEERRTRRASVAAREDAELARSSAGLAVDPTTGLRRSADERAEAEAEATRLEEAATAAELEWNAAHGRVDERAEGRRDALRRIGYTATGGDVTRALPRAVSRHFEETAQQMERVQQRELVAQRIEEAAQLSAGVEGIRNAYRGHQLEAGAQAELAALDEASRRSESAALDEIYALPSPTTPVPEAQA